MSFPLVCTVCKRPYEGPTDLYVCPHCGASIESPVAVGPEREDLKEVLRRGSSNGIWGYRPFLPVAEDVEPVTRGEGNTPLVHARNLGADFGLENLYIKNETLNPSGTYKDRFATVALSLEKARGTRAVALGSAGNAAAAVAAYSAVAGIECFILLPPGAVQERAWQNMSYGAHFIRSSGTISETIELVTAGQKAFGWKNVCTTMLHYPYGAEGYKTIAYEIGRDMKFKAPDFVISPVGGGIILSKVFRGFTEMLALGMIDKLPRFVGAQAAGCAPLVKAFEAGEKKTDTWQDPDTIAFAINDPVTFEGVTALDCLYRSNGLAVAVSDEEIVDAMRQCARREAILAEPASASSFAVARKLRRQGILREQDTVVCIATGSALRDLRLLSDAEHRPQAPVVGINDLEGLGRAIAFYKGLEEQDL